MGKGKKECNEKSLNVLVQRKRAVRKVLIDGKVSMPKKFMKELGLKEGDFVIVELQEKHLKIIPAEVKPRATRSR